MSRPSMPASAAKLLLAVTMVSPSQTTGLRRPRWRGRACGRLSSSARRRSRRSSARPAKARSRMAKLTPAPRRRRASRVGSADSRHDDGRIGHDRGGAHGGEVMAADRERQQQGADVVRLQRGRRAARRAGRQRRTAPPSSDRTATSAGSQTMRARRPRRPPCRYSAWRRCRRRRWRRRASGAGDRSPSAIVRPRPVRTIAATSESDRQGDVVAGRQAGREGQHGDEMRRPDAEAARDRRHAEPDLPALPFGLAHVMEQVDCREGGERADDGRQRDEPQVVLCDEAVIDGEHRKTRTNASFCPESRDTERLPSDLRQKRVSLMAKLPCTAKSRGAAAEN